MKWPKSMESFDPMAKFLVIAMCVSTLFIVSFMGLAIVALAKYVFWG